MLRSTEPEALGFFETVNVVQNIVKLDQETRRLTAKRINLFATDVALIAFGLR